MSFLPSQAEAARKKRELAAGRELRVDVDDEAELEAARGERNQANEAALHAAPQAGGIKVGRARVYVLVRDMHFRVFCAWNV